MKPSFPLVASHFATRKTMDASLESGTTPWASESVSFVPSKSIESLLRSGLLASVDWEGMVVVSTLIRPLAD